VLPEQDEDFLTANEATDARVQKLREYVEKYASAAAEHLLDEEAYRRFYTNRAFDGVVVKCSSLNPAGWICLIGDAAHAVQPATGEGINSGLEDAAILGAAAESHPADPFSTFNEQRLGDAHALHQIALQAKDKVVSPPPRQQAVSVMCTIGLGIAKKLKIIEGTASDFMLGEKAKTVGVMSYSDLVAMEERQTRGLKPVARGIAKVLRIPKKHPVPDASKNVGAPSDEPQQPEGGEKYQPPPQAAQVDSPVMGG
jgi:kynurenine 3-monooxygenase